MKDFISTEGLLNVEDLKKAVKKAKAICPLTRLIMNNLTDRPDLQITKDNELVGSGVKKKDIEIIGLQADSAWFSICEHIYKHRIKRAELKVYKRFNTGSCMDFVLNGIGGEGKVCEFQITVSSEMETSRGRLLNPYYNNSLFNEEYRLFDVTESIVNFSDLKFEESQISFKKAITEESGDSEKDNEIVKKTIVLWEKTFYRLNSNNTVCYMVATNLSTSTVLMESLSHGFIFETESDFSRGVLDMFDNDGDEMCVISWNDKSEILYSKEYPPKKIDKNDLLELDRLYRNGKSRLPDFVFDAIRKKLRLTEEEVTSDYVPADCTKQGKGDPCEQKILSQDKIRNVDELQKWINNTRCECVASWKYDGCAVRLHFKGRDFWSAESKGKARDVTDLMRLVRNVPTKIKAHDFFTGTINYQKRSDVGDWWVTGELVSTRGHRQEVAGFLLRKTIDSETEDLAEGLQFVAYDSNLHEVKSADGNCNVVKNYKQMLGLLQQFGFTAVECETLREAEDLENGRFASTIIQPCVDTDGVVIRINTLSEYVKRGATGHHPKGSIAYKYEDEWVKADVIKWEAEMGINGVRKFICTIKPIVLGGKTITKACTQIRSCDYEYGMDYDTYKYGYKIKGRKLSDLKQVEVCLRGKVIPQFRLTTD